MGSAVQKLRGSLALQHAAMMIVPTYVLTRGGGAQVDGVQRRPSSRRIFMDSHRGAVGHERDETLASMRPTYAATPSNAAERLVPERNTCVVMLRRMRIVCACADENSPSAYIMLSGW